MLQLIGLLALLCCLYTVLRSLFCVALTSLLHSPFPYLLIYSNMRASLLLFALLALLCFTAPFVRAQDDAAEGGVGEGSAVEEDVEEVVTETEPEPVIRALIPSPDISTTVYFPEYQDKKFVAGETVTALIGLANSGEQTYNVSATAQQQPAFTAAAAVSSADTRSTPCLL